MQSLLATVQDLLEQLEAGTLRPGFQAPVQRGSAAGRVSILENREEPDRPVIQVSLGVMRLPAGREAPFCRRLLELNTTLQGRAAFALEDGIVRLVAGRSVEDLDPGELIDLILWTSEQADRLDDRLLAEFGPEHAL